MRQLAQENDDYDLTTAGGVAVLTQTPSASGWTKCAVHLAIGDGVKDMDGTGGDFELYVTIGGKPVNPYPQTITFAAEVTAAQSTDDFVVPPNAALVVKIKSPNGADTDVDVTATLIDVGPLQPSVAGTQYTGPTVVVSAVSVAATAANDSGALTITRHSTYRTRFTGLNSLAGRTGLKFSIKPDVKTLGTTADSAALLLIDENAGLEVVNGGAADDSSLASITVIDDTTVDLYIDEEITGLLTAGVRKPYSFKLLDSAGDDQEITSVDYANNATTLARVLEAVTRAV